MKTRAKQEDDYPRFGPGEDWASPTELLAEMNKEIERALAMWEVTSEEEVDKIQDERRKSDPLHEAVDRVSEPLYIRASYLDMPHHMWEPKESFRRRVAQRVAKIERLARKEREAAEQLARKEREAAEQLETIKRQGREEVLAELKAEKDACAREAENKRKEREKAKAKTSTPEYRQRQRAHLLATKYNLTEEQYQAVFKAQHGRCAACKLPFGPARDFWPCVDHDHATGEVRGLLCHLCNMTLGHAHDNPEILRGLLRYLESKRVSGR